MECAHPERRSCPGGSTPLEQHIVSTVRTVRGGTTMRCREWLASRVAESVRDEARREGG